MHKTQISGTEYEILSGKTQVSGTEYEILEGKTQVSGTQYDIAFGGGTLGDMRPGKEILLMESGDWTPYIVAQQSYEPELNEDRTLMIRKYVLPGTQKWHSAQGQTDWEDTDLFETLAYDLPWEYDVVDELGDTYYKTWNWSRQRLSETPSAVFLLSEKELGSSQLSVDEGTMIQIAEDILIAETESGEPVTWWTRSYESEQYAVAVNGDGIMARKTKTTKAYIRPALTLSASLPVTEGKITGGA